MLLNDVEFFRSLGAVSLQNCDRFVKFKNNGFELNDTSRTECPSAFNG